MTHGFSGGEHLAWPLTWPLGGRVGLPDASKMRTIQLASENPNHMNLGENVARIILRRTDLLAR
jgi:hypothetical protein